MPVAISFSSPMHNYMRSILPRSFMHYSHKTLSDSVAKAASKPPAVHELCKMLGNHSRSCHLLARVFHANIRVHQDNMPIDLSIGLVKITMFIF